MRHDGRTIDGDGRTLLNDPHLASPAREGLQRRGGTFENVGVEGPGGRSLDAQNLIGQRATLVRSVRGDWATATASGLAPDTAYRFRVKATNDHGESGWSAPSQVLRTAAVRPPPPMPLVDPTTKGATFAPAVALRVRLVLFLLLLLPSSSSSAAAASHSGASKARLWAAAPW